MGGFYSRSVGSTKAVYCLGGEGGGGTKQGKSRSLTPVRKLRERVRDDNAGEAEFAELEIRPRRSAAATFVEGWMARGVAATEARPKTGVVGLKPRPYKKKGES